MQHLKTLDVYMVINDCEIIIAALIGKKGIGRLQEKGVKLFLRKGDITEALNSVFRDEEYYNPFSEGQYSPNSPILHKNKYVCIKIAVFI